MFQPTVTPHDGLEFHELYIGLGALLNPLSPQIPSPISWLTAKQKFVDLQV